ncbi:MAG: 1-deoxy-D-xylulose-5-phosphate synthase [Clostridia bacterium]|nr:1-deoxy-D-xylulose-5-phosphate synthase [Clostridia bacterium]
MLEYKVLNSIKSPDDVKKLSNDDTNVLCDEIRNKIIDVVSKNGGHLASSLGTVELTVALHRVFSSPKDAIIFDVGHQSYAHKLLTGRLDRFDTLRQEGGISGFMRPDESEHDPFVTGHSSNSISAAYGISKAKTLTGTGGKAIAVIGDGAMTGGMAYEALNNAGAKKGNFIVVINDNKMSISRNVGAMPRAFTKMRNQSGYHKLKFIISNILLKIPLIGKPLHNFIYLIKESLKSLVYKNNFFAGLGFNYLGPVNGHDVKAMEQLLNIAKSYNRPTIVHVVTTKGKGYLHAENKPKDYHGVSSFDVEKGKDKSKMKTYSDVVGETLCQLATKNKKVCAITAAMTEGTGLNVFAAKYRPRFFDVGIAEQHAVTFAAGLATGGMVPYFAVYSTFLQRGYDQVLHDAAIANVPIKLLVDRAGIVGDDGESHQGVFDVAYLSTIPNVNIYSPCYYDELKRSIIDTANKKELSVIRYPRGVENKNFDGEISGDYTVLSQNSKKVIVTYGRIFANAVEAQKSLDNVDLIKLNKIYPIANELVELLLKYDEIYFFEEGILSGGIGEHIAAQLYKKDFKGKYNVNAINNEFIGASTIESALKKYHLDSESMIEIVGK